ncbi:MAG: ankyrin repeat domain-containing protein [Legionella sp.]|uniref:ankyrin repeat domain-containing protein n=1 Tax=Legionella sp. TaxID=459 RepID=UPI002845B4C5|nr:ankyrin repeat domain-containing protein [Legionella sp.]
MADFSRLIIAASDGNKRKLIKYLDKGDPVNDLSSGISALWIAAQEGHHDICLELLARGATVDLEGPGNQTPLWIASSQGHVDVVKLLIGYGADHSKLGNGVSPLWIAVQNSSDEVAAALITAGANVNFQLLSTGYSCLMQAIPTNNLVLFETLIAAKADFNLASFSGITPLMLASDIGNNVIISRLLEEGAKRDVADDNGFTAVYYAQAANNYTAQQLLLSNGAQVSIGQSLLPNFYKFMDLLKSIAPEKYNLLDSLEYAQILKGGLCAGYANLCLMLHGIEKVGQFHNTLKNLALWDGQKETLSQELISDFYNVIQILVELHIQTRIIKKNSRIKAPNLYCEQEVLYQRTFCTGFLFKQAEVDDFLRVTLEAAGQIILASLNHAISIYKTDDQHFVIYNFTSAIGAVIASSYSQLSQKVQVMLGEKENIYGLQCFFVQPSSAHPISSSQVNNYLHSLLQKRKNENEVNLASRQGLTALHYSLTPNNMSLVNYLTENGARVNFNHSIIPPLYLAVQSGDADIVTALVNAGAEVNCSHEGHSPLGLAISENHSLLAKFLIESGADIEYKHPTVGYAAIHIAAQNGNIDLVDFLLRKGVSINSLGQNDEPPLIIAINKGHKDIVKLLLANNADTNLATKDLGIVSYAILFGTLEILKILCDNGADLTKPNVQGLTPLQIATFSKHPEKISYIQTQISAKTLADSGFFETNSLQRKSSIAENEASPNSKKRS